MHLIAKVIRILCANFHCNRLTTVQDIQDYASLIFGAQCVQCVREKKLEHYTFHGKTAKFQWI